MLLGQGMYRLLILAVALPFLGNAELGRAEHDPYDVEIVAIDLAGRRTNLTRNPAWDSSPAVARDGRIVFLSTRDGAADFYVMDGDGRHVRRLTVGQGVWSEDLDFSQASWSPRAARIAFDSQGAPPTPGCLQHCANWDVRHRRRRQRAEAGRGSRQGALLVSRRSPSRLLERGRRVPGGRGRDDHAPRRLGLRSRKGVLWLQLRQSRLVADPGR